jgi:YggT family protein
MISLTISIINFIANALILVLIINALLSFVLSPYHPIRETLNRIIEPFQAPIRRVVPPVGMFDFSPLVLIVLIEVLNFVLISILNTLR